MSGETNLNEKRSIEEENARKEIKTGLDALGYPEGTTENYMEIVKEIIQDFNNSIKLEIHNAIMKNVNPQIFNMCILDATTTIYFNHISYLTMNGMMGKENFDTLLKSLSSAYDSLLTSIKEIKATSEEKKEDVSKA